MTVQRPRFAPLLEIAAEARGQQWASELSGAITAASQAGWAWERTFIAAAKLITDPEGHPRNLLYEVRGDPTASRPGAWPPPEEWAKAKAALATREPAAPGAGAA